MKSQLRVPHALPTDRTVGLAGGPGASRGTEDPRDREEIVGPGLAAVAPVAFRVGALFENRMLDALAKSLVCFAILHQLVLGTHLAMQRDWSVLNVFTMLEAQKLFPRLASGAGMQWISLLFALAVYALVLGFLTRRPDLRRAAGLVLAPPAVPHPHRARPSLALGIVAFLSGVAVHMGCLALVERFVSTFPSVPDVVQVHLPYVDFGVFGELCFVGFLATVVTVLIRTQARAVGGVLVMLGLFYATRGVFLFLLPIGSPPTAPALAERFVFYPYAAHGYFPGGHAGLMTILSLSIAHARWRRGLFAVTVVFALGTMLSRTHYSADALAGCLLGAGIVAWGRRRLGVAVRERRPVAARSAAPFARPRIAVGPVAITPAPIVTELAAPTPPLSAARSSPR